MFFIPPIISPMLTISCQECGRPADAGFTVTYCQDYRDGKDCVKISEEEKKKEREEREKLNNLKIYDNKN